LPRPPIVVDAYAAEGLGTSVFEPDWLGRYHINGADWNWQIKEA